MQYYIAISALLIFNIITIGGIIPSLISYPDWLAVALGYVILVSVVPINYYSIKFLFTKTGETK